MAPPAVQTPETIHRVEVITLAVPNDLAVAQFLEDDSVTAEKLVKHWKEGKAELAEFQTVNAGSQTEGKAKNAMVRYFYRGTRYAGGPGERGIPDYEQRNIGSELKAKLGAEDPVESGLRLHSREVALSVTVQYATEVELDSPKENNPSNLYPSVITVDFTGKARLFFDKYTLISGGRQISEKGSVLFLLAKLGTDSPPPVPSPGLRQPPR